MDRCYEAIGRAVIHAQTFEAALTACYEFFKMKIDPKYRDETGGFISEANFRQHVSSIVQNLRKAGHIHADLEHRIVAFVEQRNELIHRWVIHNGIPETNQDEWRRLLELATHVNNEALALSRTIAEPMVKDFAPGSGYSPSEEMQRVLQIFQIPADRQRHV